MAWQVKSEVGLKEEEEEMVVVVLSCENRKGGGQGTVTSKL